MERKVIPLILAGGKGSRFWPLSRENCPKQFLHLNGDDSLLQKTMIRAKRIAENAVPYVIAGADQYSLVLSSLREQEGEDFYYIGEPFRRNTAAAIYYGCRCIRDAEGDGIIVVLPADHYISLADQFADDVASAVALAEEKNGINLFGIRPTYPATGFGYAEVKRSRSCNGISYYHVRHFTEKPKKEKAKHYLKKGNYYWNSGISVFTLDKIFSVYEKFFPQLVSDFDGFSFEEKKNVYDAYERAESVSFDTAILEKEKDIFLLAANFDWDDVGSFQRLSSLLPSDKNNNICSGNILLNDVSDSVILTDNYLTVLVGIKNLIVAEDHGVLMICSSNKGEQIGEISSLLTEENSVFR